MKDGGAARVKMRDAVKEEITKAQTQSLAKDRDFRLREIRRLKEGISKNICGGRLTPYESKVQGKLLLALTQSETDLMAEKKAERGKR